MNSMKSGMAMKVVCAFVAVVVLVAIVLAIVNTNDVATQVDKELRKQKEVDALVESYNISEARRNGDTYCRTCKKVNAGYVRICEYCGQYLN